MGVSCQFQGMQPCEELICSITIERQMLALVSAHLYLIFYSARAPANELVQCRIGNKETESCSLFLKMLA